MPYFKLKLRFFLNFVNNHLKFKMNEVYHGFKPTPFPSGNVSRRILIQSTNHQIKLANEQTVVMPPKTIRTTTPALPSRKN